ncbi:hypothetical protein OOZ15_11420 [Galbibacter sp. EGI 63066]|uniref:hypothetical protein n=1 Tax=Galbibacter sp. EGI 63066 TaxID=2993559 RepID=UPI0022495849|nr:hypothetical protein [Galbibacter sp. EGI 63066]MCX2680552.1 hypothetical protein [Galbibacter sp. EGI 63066]
MKKDTKTISPKELLEMLPSITKSKKYLGWRKLIEEDLEKFNLEGILNIIDGIENEYKTEKNYWDIDYPIALNFYPNCGSEIYFDGHDYYLVYRDFGGHVPEKRCRLIRKELIVNDKRST